MWYPGYQQIEIPGRQGLPFTGEPNWKILLHTVEGTVEGALAQYRNGVGCPHFTVSPARRIKIQHVDTAYGAYALRNVAGGTETNRDPVIQIEIEGFAKDTQYWGEEWLRWLGEEVIAPILQDKPVDHRVASVWVPTSAAYGLNAPQRFTAAQWDAFSGILGHQHAPENSHWDPGGLNAQLILDFAVASIAAPPVPPSPPSDEVYAMTDVYLQDGTNVVLGKWSSGVVRQITWPELQAARYFRIPESRPPADQWAIYLRAAGL